uniref:Uncharacterized protein n=1 Tax=Panagrolaimus sp. JU765 TaxID=591449 RepID=A0AC34QEY9_9BILA
MKILILGLCFGIVFFGSPIIGMPAPSYLPQENYGENSDPTMDIMPIQNDPRQVIDDTEMMPDMTNSSNTDPFVGNDGQMNMMPFYPHPRHGGRMRNDQKHQMMDSSQVRDMDDDMNQQY